VAQAPNCDVPVTHAPNAAADLSNEAGYVVLPPPPHPIDQLAAWILLDYFPFMNLARHSISATKPIQIFDAKFDPECKIFTASTPAGFAVYDTWPLKLIRKRGMPILSTPTARMQLMLCPPATRRTYWRNALHRTTPAHNEHLIPPRRRS
jgi:hypothetical protein